MHRRLTAVIVLLLAACSPSDDRTADVEVDGCRAAEGVDASPSTIEGVLALMNSLPKPVTVECFVESLERPMPIIGSLDTASAQPSNGEHAPRLFAIYGTMVISFVPDGEGSRVIEFAEQRPNLRSVKAELKMPIEDEATPEDAFEHIKQENGEGTICGTCHVDEERATDITYGEAYVSRAFRPTRPLTVTLDYVEAEHEACDPDATPRRCSIYDALFSRGNVYDGDFPRPLPTILD